MPSFSSTAVAAFAIMAGMAKGYETLSGYDITFYTYSSNGYNDQVAYNCLGRNYAAGGDGSYDNPLTFASSSGGNAFSECQVLWFPYLEKYIVNSDSCSGCSGQHIDVWLGIDQSANGEDACADDLTPNNTHDLVAYGNTGHDANTGPLFTVSGGCQTQNAYPNNE